eukprot:4891105-Prymnesium_polylepis.2
MRGGEAPGLVPGAWQLLGTRGEVVHVHAAQPRCSCTGHVIVRAVELHVWHLWPGAMRDVLALSDAPW